MNWLEEVKSKRRNQILFSKDNSLIQELNSLLQGYSHRVLVLWALSLAEESVSYLEKKYPDELRFRIALDETRRWAAGEIKMPQAKRAILACHAVAKELDDVSDKALCHAIGQACSVVHTPRHVLGYPMYELTAIVRSKGFDACVNAVEERFKAYEERLVSCALQLETYQGRWAKFIKE